MQRRCFLGPDEALYNLGGGQWHYEMGFSDPYFGSTQAMVSAYYAQLGKNPTYDGAACMAAGSMADHVVEGSQCHGPLPVPDVLSACRDLKAVNDFEKLFPIE